MSDDATKALALLKEKLGSVDLSNLAGDQAIAFLKIVSDAEISRQEIAGLIQLAPSLVQTVTETLKSIPIILQNSTEAQKSVLQSNEKIYKSMLDALERTAANMSTDDGRSKIADSIVELAKIAFSSNEKVSDNMASSTSSGWNLLYGALVLVAAVFGGPKALAALRK